MMRKQVIINTDIIDLERSLAVDAMALLGCVGYKVGSYFLMSFVEVGMSIWSGR